MSETIAVRNEVASGPSAAPMPMPIRIVLLTNDVPAYRVSTLAALRDRVEALTVLLAGARCPSGTAHSKAGGGTRRPDDALGEDPAAPRPLGSALRVPAVLKREGARYIVSSEMGLRSAMAALHWMRHRDCRLILHADLSEETERGRGWARTVLRRLLLRRVDWVIVNGASGERYVRSLGFPATRISHVPYATDTALFGAKSGLDCAAGVAAGSGGAGSGSYRLLYVGRLIGLKGLERFVGTLGRVLQRRPELDVSLTLAGDGDRRAAIEAVPRPPNLRLRLLGAVRYEALPAVYAEADAFVFPSLRDTWGLVVNEAMASGLPVLGSVRALAVEETVRDGCSGWHFDPLAEESVEAALHRFFATPAAARWQMGQRARDAALELSPDAVAARIVDACVRSDEVCRG